ncbi:MAG: hypothetical protein CVT49_08920 [candidate division Zixibacteria bacterium HGW-Zixibacteria-1]|nr:MAG: hypothetical protein CVT49_08920 [candidate division Zixibacteria bacterium HGW-Zixibacteria-1]
MEEKDAKEILKNFQDLKKELEAIKHLLALQLKNAGVNVTLIGKAMGISQGRVSQILGESKRKK